MAKVYYNKATGQTRKTRVRWDRVVIVFGGAFIIVGMIIALNFNRIKCFFKGYNFRQTNEILNLKKTEQKIILGEDKIDNVSYWIKERGTVSSFDEYEKYYKMFPDMEKEDVILTVNSILEKANSLENLGYTEEILWKILEKATVSDLSNIITNKYAAEELMKYYAVKGFMFSHYENYRSAYATYADYAYSVNVVNYPSIISSNGINRSYTIKNPNELLTLIKNGFYIPEDYKPDNLVIPNVNIVDNCKDKCYVRKDMEADLVEMFKAAETLGYKLYISSAYRSFEDQQAIYDEMAYRYGGAYAKEYVAQAGASEHQLGLGLDLTSQNVLDGINNVFRDTVDYQWVAENCYKYGFILRYQDEKSNITGVASEPWHVRYVGKDAAKIIYEEGITFEEYCLKYSILPDLEVK